MSFSIPGLTKPPTTFRVDAVAGVVALLESFRTANPDAIRAVSPVRPASYGETPLVYVGSRDETITHSGQLRQRAMTALEIVVVDVVSDNLEVSARMDALVDALVDLFTANVHAISATTVVAPTAVTDIDVPELGGDYRHTVITLGDASALEGRS